MKIQYISDLHLEFQGKKVRRDFKVSPEADVLVLAGDCHTQPDGMGKFFKKIRKDHSLPIIYVLGNHEYYGHSTDIIHSYKKVCEDHNVSLLQNDFKAIKVNDELIHVLGTTLYSDLSDPLDALSVSKGLTDFRVVKKIDGTPIDVEWWNDRFLTSKQFLERYLKIAKENNRPETKILVVTHFGPLLQVQGPNYTPSRFSRGFISDLSDLFIDYKIDGWIYGHTHDPVNMDFQGCKVRSNQLGYPSEPWLKLKIELLEV